MGNSGGSNGVNNNFRNLVDGVYTEYSGNLSMYGENWTNYDNEYTGASAPGTSSDGGDESRPSNYTIRIWKRIS